VKKLRANVDERQGSEIKNYDKAALTLYDLESVLAPKKALGAAAADAQQLESLEFLQKDIAWVKRQSTLIRNKADADLRTGIAELDAKLLTTAAQAFFNLHCLWDVLQGVLRACMEGLEEKLYFRSRLQFSFPKRVVSPSADTFRSGFPAVR